MKDRFELVEVIGNGENWKLKTLATFRSLDEASQMLVALSRQFLDRHFTLYEIYD